eukprot:TRINITY_DN40997_c0_g1_i2.p1 TRINITY_DN40997_c0_g1~~TRINITY_DN40997_c0_g1_i2.p1  ORF type:complete len:221 (+),score=39.56 TRINITY_DN40997_c0_g1_i2:136-798(+)
MEWAPALVFEPLTLDNVDSCLDTVAAAMDSNEPVNTCLGISVARTRTVLEGHREAFLKYASPSELCLSFVVRDTATDELVAGFLNTDLCEGSPSGGYSTEDSKEAYEYLCAAQEDEDAGTTMDFSYSGVLPAYRGRGLQSEARKLAIIGARARGFKYGVSFASSHFSIKSMLKRGAEMRAQLVYKEWTNSKGEIPFEEAAEPHEVWALMRVNFEELESKA